MRDEAQCARPLATVLPFQGAGVPRCPAGKLCPLKLLSEKGYLWTSFWRHSDVYRLCPGLDPELKPLPPARRPARGWVCQGVCRAGLWRPARSAPAAGSPRLRAARRYTGGLEASRVSATALGRTVHALAPPARQTECAPQEAGLR